MNMNDVEPFMLSSRYCPECGWALIPESGCFYCRVCGYSACR